MTKFCKDCKYFCPRWDAPPSCMNAVTGVDLVHGSMQWRECAQERMDHNTCGSAGTLFEPKKSLTPSPTSETIKTRSYNWFKTFWK